MQIGWIKKTKFNKNVSELKNKTPYTYKIVTETNFSIRKL